MYLDPLRIFRIQREIRLGPKLRNTGRENTQFLRTKDVVEKYDKPFVFF
jgi:hypothetical protein